MVVVGPYRVYPGIHPAPSTISHCTGLGGTVAHATLASKLARGPLPDLGTTVDVRLTTHLSQSLALPTRLQRTRVHCRGVALNAFLFWNINNFLKWKMLCGPSTVTSMAKNASHQWPVTHQGPERHISGQSHIMAKSHISGQSVTPRVLWPLVT